MESSSSSHSSAQPLDFIYNPSATVLQLSLLTLYIILQLQFYSFSVRLLELRGQLGGGAHYQHAVAKVKSNRTQHKYV